MQDLEQAAKTLGAFVGLAGRVMAPSYVADRQEATNETGEGPK